MIDPCCFVVDDNERRLLVQAASWPKCLAWHALTAEALRDLAIGQGLDFATAVLFDRLVRSPEHGPFIEEVARWPEREPGLSECRPTVAVVPGAFYREDGTSGADGRSVLEAVARLGCPGETIPLRSFGGLAESARTLRDWLRSRADNGPVVLVSLSKAGAEVKLALAAPDAADVFRNVLAWISLSGLFHGTPLVSWLRRRPWRLGVIRLLFWLRGYEFKALGELERGPGRPLDFTVQLPPHLRVIHVVGFPLMRHLSCPLARRGHRRSGRLGPNDGGPIVLADLRSLPGHVYPVWGADHYLRPAGDMRPLLTRLLDYVTRQERLSPLSPQG